MTTQLILDLETVASDTAIALGPAEEYLSRGIGSHFKPETVEEYRKKNRAKWDTEGIHDLSKDWRTGRIIAIGVVEAWGGSANTPWVGLGTTEAALLSAFWQLAEQVDQLVGFNLLGFDWPFLLFRSAVHGLTPTRRFKGSRYGGGDLIDWQDLLCNFDRSRTTGYTLAKYAALFDLPHQPTGEGSQVWGWWQEGRHDLIQEHLASDLLTTRDLHQRCAPIYLGV